METESPSALKQQLEEILKHRGVNGEPVFFSVAGSHSFNLSVPTSDKDYFGVYLCSSKELLSPFYAPPELLDSHEPDYTISELSNFAKLLLKGNPKLIEPLFSTHLCYSSSEWEELRPFFPRFLTQSVVRHYVSYAFSQISHAQAGKGVVTKKYYHIIRLLSEARRILSGGTPKVWMEGEMREFLMNVRNGLVDQQTLDDVVKKLEKDCEEGLNGREMTFSMFDFTPCLPCALPLEGDINLLNKWIIQIRKKGILRDIDKLDNQFSKMKVGDEKPLIGKREALRSRAQDYIHRAGVENGKILFCGISGSDLHGLSTDKDAVQDFIAIYSTPVESIWSLFPPPKYIDDAFFSQSSQSSGHPLSSSSTTKGWMLFEVGYALQLIFQGNHRLLEILWADYNDSDRPSYSTEAWEELKKACVHLLCTKPVSKHLWGIASGLLFRPLVLKEDPVQNLRPLYHVYRHMFTAQSVVQGQTPQITVQDEAKRDFLLKLKKGEGDPNALFSEAKKLVQHVDDEIGKRWGVPKREKGVKKSEKSPVQETDNRKNEIKEMEDLKKVLSDWIVAYRINSI